MSQRIYPVVRKDGELVEQDSDLELDGLSDSTIPKAAIDGTVGSGDPVDILEGGTEVVADAADIDFESGPFTVNNPSSGVAKVVFDAGNVSHDALGNISKGDHRTDEQIEDLVATILSAAGNISITHDDANDTITVDTAALNQEEVEDAVAALIASSENLAWNYDDANDALTVSLSGPIEGVQIGTSSNPAPAVYTDEISVGQGSSVDAVFGGFGKFVKIATYDIADSSTSSGSFVTLNSPKKVSPFDPATGLSSDIYASITARLDPDSTTATVRAEDSPRTEVQRSSTGIVGGNIGLFEGFTTNIDVELKSGDGSTTVSISRANLNLWRRIE